MADWVKERDGFVSKHGGTWVFIKAQLSAQLASIVDILLTILLFKLCGVFYLYATFLGSVIGGVVNCVINYEWTFHAEGCKKKHVALKYISVWVGSILLNTWGTFAMTEWLTSMTWVNHALRQYVDDLFLVPKILVAVLVAFFWNYYLQRVFVYRNHDIKGFMKQYFGSKKEEYEL